MEKQVNYRFMLEEMNNFMSRIIVKLTDDELESLVNGGSVTACLSPYKDYSNLQAVTIVRKTELTVKKYIDDSKEA